jgi:hypothetical protein
MPWLRPRILLALPLLHILAAPAIVGCATDECTEMGCENSVRVDYEPGLVSGPYDLLVTGDNGSLTGRCDDPGAPEAEDNPEELFCDNRGFVIQSGPLATSVFEVFVTIVDVESGDAIVESCAVGLTAGEPQTPNGPDCPPTCYEHTGYVELEACHGGYDP